MKRSFPRAARPAVTALLLALTLTVVMVAGVGAHNLKVTNPETGEVVNEVWAGGFTVPADAEPMFGPFNLPPSHDKGLPKSCQGTASSPAVQFIAPPYGSCEHGVP